jgi:hypothetical protein
MRSGVTRESLGFCALTYHCTPQPVFSNLKGSYVGTKDA